MRKKEVCHRCQIINHLWVSFQFFKDSFCSSCMMQKPERSKHCSVCNRFSKMSRLSLIIPTSTTSTTYPSRNTSRNSQLCCQGVWPSSTTTARSLGTVSELATIGPSWPGYSFSLPSLSGGKSQNLLLFVSSAFQVMASRCHRCLWGLLTVLSSDPPSPELDSWWARAKNQPWVRTNLPLP